jgi:hypothetical protein
VRLGGVTDGFALRFMERPGLALAACALAHLLVGSPHAAGPPAAGAPREVAARAAWTRAGFVYLEADSGSLRPGTTLTFRRGRNTVATAVVDRVLESRVTRARLASGSLEREKRLGRLRVSAVEPVVEQAGVLRVGVPAMERGNLLFRCAPFALEPRLAGATHDVDTLARNLLRLRRSPPQPGDGAPDTLLVRLFADAADQEIALERGELDVALFWPGEGSPRLRADPRFQGAPLGLRARGVIAVVGDARGGSAADPAALAAVNREVFGGDLLAWDQLEPPPAAPGVPALAPVVADPALPGARLMDRVLARWGAPRSREPLRLALLDVPVAAGDAVSAGWRAPGVRPAFAIRCPVLVSPAGRAALAALGGPDAIANLLRCGSAAP